MEQLPKTDSKTLKEALSLSQDILKNIELNEITLEQCALKASRLARLINDFESEQWLCYEREGYPITTGGVPQPAWDAGVKAGRLKIEEENGQTKKGIFVESISSLESQISSSKAHLEVIHDPDIHIHSTNDCQRVYDPSGDHARNYLERNRLEGQIKIATERLAKVRSAIYQYVLNVYNELRYSEIVNDIFARVRNRVDNQINDLIPDAVKRFTSAYDNLDSENPEGWSNAVTSCRRILKDLADAIYPPKEGEHKIFIGDKKKSVNLDKDHYKNRILAFVSDRSESENFRGVVGSNIQFLVDRLESIYASASKGVHDTILTRDEAERYVVYTYLLVGDILSLL